MELGIIRWSIAGSTSNFKMNLPHFLSVEVNGTSSRVRVSCAARKRVAAPLKRNHNARLQSAVFKKICCIMKQRMLIGPVSVFHFACQSYLILNVL